LGSFAIETIGVCDWSRDATVAFPVGLQKIKALSEYIGLS